MLAKPLQPLSASSQAPHLQCSHQTLTALIEVASAGLSRHFPKASGDTLDVELVLDALRMLRPKVAEIETLQGVLHIVNGRWDDALVVLRDVIDVSPSFSYAKAMVAYCLASNGDAQWRRWAEEAREGEATPETRALIRALEVRADLQDARANHRGGEFVMPESYREFEEAREGGATKSRLSNDLSTDMSATPFGFLRA
jgi:type III secretion protein HrpB1